MLLYGLWRWTDHTVLPVLPELRGSCLYFFEGLVDLGALVRRGLTIGICTAYRITGYTRALFLLCEMCLCDLLVVLVQNVRGHALHTEDFNLEALTTWIRVLDMCEILLVDLGHVYVETW